MRKLWGKSFYSQNIVVIKHQYPVFFLVCDCKLCSSVYLMWSPQVKLRWSRFPNAPRSWTPCPIPCCRSWPWRSGLVFSSESLVPFSPLTRWPWRLINVPTLQSSTALLLYLQIKKSALSRHFKPGDPTHWWAPQMRLFSFSILTFNDRLCHFLVHCPLKCSYLYN